jgi:alpha-2-macroglobulin
MRFFRFIFTVVFLFSFRPTETFAAVFEGSAPYKELLAKIELLASEQKIQAAQDVLNAGMSTITIPNEQARLLIKLVQLETALHGTETAVQLIKSKTWPKEPEAFALLGLFHAKTLQNYAQMYSWEIRQREKTVSKNEKDLKTWTVQEIYGDAYRTLAEVWKLRDKLANISKNDLTDLISPNNYPVGLRDTFRDSFAFLLVDILIDSAGWSPAQSNELNALKLSQLLNPSVTNELNLANEKIHPLEKISVVLEDLRLWNTAKGNAAGALMAKLKMYQILQSQFTSDEDQEFLIQHLTKLTDASVSNPAYSSAMAVLAGFWKMNKAPQALQKARQIAKLGSEKFTESIGARQCRNLIKEIDRPSFEVQAMKVDGKKRKTILIQYKNIRKLYFRSFPFDLKQFMISSKDYNLYPSWKEFEGLLKQKFSQEWHVDLDSTTDFRTHNHYPDIPDHQNGFYIIVGSMNPDFGNMNNILQGAMVNFSSLVLASRMGHSATTGKIELETFDGASGELIRGVKVSFYRRQYQKNHQLVGSQNSDAKGRIEFASSAGPNSYGFFAIAEHQGSQGFFEFNLWPSGEAPSQQNRSIMYTDRSIYRPLQKIMWKSVIFRSTGQAGGFKTINPSEVPRIQVSLFDPNSREIQKLDAKVDEFGSVWGEFIIPPSGLLGNWSIRLNNQIHYIKVEEYKRPTFELNWIEQKTAIRLNQRADIFGEAKYLFGLPVTQGQVKYKIEKQVILPWWYFWSYWNYGSLQKNQIVHSGVTQLKSDGTFSMSFTPKADPRLLKSSKDSDGVKYSFLITADITDEGGETRSSQKLFMVSSVSIEAELKLDGNVLIENSLGEIKLSRLFVAGGSAPGSGQWTLSRLKEPTEVVMPAEMKLMNLDINGGLVLDGDRRSPRWENKYNWQALVREWTTTELIKSDLVLTDKTGHSVIKLPPLKPGAYRMVYSSKDSYGEAIQSQTEFFVANRTYRPALPGLFLADKSSAKVNEKINFWLPTGFKNQSMVFEVFQDNEILERRYINSTKDSALIEWTMTEAHRGGLSFVVRLLNDYQSLSFSQSIFVPWDNKQISIETKTFRDRLRPGQNEKWTVQLLGPNKKKLQKASVQLLAYMYDRSLDQLASHYSPSLLSIYPNRAHFSPATFFLGIAPQAYFSSNFNVPMESVYIVEDQLKFYSNYGIGGPGARGGFMMKDANTSRRGLEDSSMAGLAAAPEASASVAEVSLEQSKKSEGAADKLEKNGAVSNKKLGADAPANDIPIRSQFAETAFFLPNLTNNEDGTVDFSFDVPDSVTSWTLWLQAFTRDLMAGSLTRQAETIKELMVRPYLPRFLREGDRAQIKIVVNNSSDKTILGTLNIDITDETQKKDLADVFKVSKKQITNVPFSVQAKKSFNHEITLQVPAGLGQINVKATAKAPGGSDGELRSIPILPGRFHLAQSQFVTLNNKDSRKMNFDDLAKNSDASLINEKIIIQIDAQLFYSVLTALPYLVNYPLECVEQTLNRFLSTGILTSMYSKFPSIEKMAKTLSSRKTRQESFNQPDPNRRMALEETPWLQASRGGSESADQLTNILDSRIAQQTRVDSLNKLEQAQTSLGGFPWFAGGPPSPYITMYVLYGFSKALEFGIQVPKPMIQKAWAYLHKHYLTAMVNDCMAHNSCWEEITFLNYILSNFPDVSWGNNIFTQAERTTMLDFSFRHWTRHSPYLKGYLALTLSRAQRAADAKLVWDSVMDSAKYSRDEGTHWMREDRSWLWYNDTIETHAFALRTLMELGSDNSKRDGLVQWIFLNKKLNHWNSTRATSEVIYSLAHYLSKTNQLGKKESVKITVGQQPVINLEFLPDQYTGKKNQIIYDGDQVKPALLPVKIEKETPGIMFASTTWHYSTEKLPVKSEGDFLSVDRNYFLRKTVGAEVQLLPIAEGQTIQVGDEVEVQLSLRSKHQVGYLHLRDPRGAGFEPVDVKSQHKWDLGLYWYEEIRDSGTNFFFENLPQGEYRFKYRIRATTAGDFKVSPATVQPMYAPEFAAYSAGLRLKIAALKN